MDFALTETQLDVRRAIEEVCTRFDDAYWLNKDNTGEFPEEFFHAMADGGWLGVATPVEYGGSGLRMSEATTMFETICASGAGTTGSQTISINVFGMQPVIAHGSEEQKRRWLPDVIAGTTRTCFAVTEPNTGLDTLKLKTFALRKGDRYFVNGQKIWISTVQVAKKMMLLARTTPLSEVSSPSEGLTLFFTNLDRTKVEIHPIKKMGRTAVDSNQLFIENLEMRVEDRIGEEGQGFKYILSGLNPERMVSAAQAIGLGRGALDRAVRYAGERIVFDRPIGKNQGIQHPLAERWIDLEAGRLLYQRAAWLFDSGQSCGAEANAAKYFCAEAGFRACETAVLTHGGMGYAKEFHVERFFREAMVSRLAPISPQLVLCFIAEKVLGLPKSY